MGSFDKYGNYHANPNDRSARSDERSVNSRASKEASARKKKTKRMISDASKSSIYSELDENGDVKIPMSSVSGSWPSPKSSFLHGIGACSCTTAGCCDAGWSE